MCSTTSFPLDSSVHCIKIKASQSRRTKACKKHGHQNWLERENEWYDLHGVMDIFHPDLQRREVLELHHQQSCALAFLPSNHLTIRCTPRTTMSTKPICTSCLRALRQTARRPIRSSQSLRLLSTTPVRADYTVNPPRAEAQPDASTMQKFAQRMRAQKQMLAATEPYVAYGSTQELFRICGRPGEYTMPKVENEENKKVLETGEEIGVGEGWWYNGTSPFTLC